MEDRRIVKMKGNPLVLSGNEVKTGQSAPDFEVLDNGLSPVKFSSFRGKICLVSSVPSLDTSVCDIQTRKFNEKVATLDSNVVVLTISMDLPFAQKRWCGASGLKNVLTFSDHRKAEFGKAFGVLIEQLRLLARAVFIVDAAGVIRYIQIVKELTNEPDYNEAIEALKGIIK